MAVGGGSGGGGEVKTPTLLGSVKIKWVWGWELVMPRMAECGLV